MCPFLFLQREEVDRKHRAELEAAAKKGAKELKAEKEFQAFWKAVNEDADEVSAAPVLGAQ